MGIQAALEGVGLGVGAMRVLVTGHQGYIGTALAPLLRRAGHEVIGLDSNLFGGCTFGPAPDEIPAIPLDLRDVGVDHLAGIEAVVHLAGISNDPLGDLNPDCTYDINYRGTVRLAEVARAAGVPRFLFSSSCSLYGAHGDDPIDESAEFNPVTPYGESKVLAEAALHDLADDAFSPTYLRNATVYGVSPRLRGDLVVNNLTGYALTTGEVLMRSDGTPWRPLVHVSDVCRAFLAVLAAPRDVVHDEAFNVGGTGENYRVRDVAGIVEEIVPDSVVRFAAGAGPDKRNYRVNCDKLARTLPEARPRRTVRDGVSELYDTYRRHGLTLDALEGRLLRIKTITTLLAEGRLDPQLRWVGADVAAAGGHRG